MAQETVASSLEILSLEVVIGLPVLVLHLPVLLSVCLCPVVSASTHTLFCYFYSFSLIFLYMPYS